MNTMRAATLGAQSVLETIERHRAFWASDSVQRPLEGFVAERPLGLSGDEGSHELMPMAIQEGVQRGLDIAERGYVAEGVLEGDLFRCATIPGEPPWMPAILGCRLLVSPSSHTQWREPLPGGWEQLLSLGSDVGEVWRAVLCQSLGVMVDRFGGRFPIATFHGRGPVDMLAHALGESEMCVRVADDPRGVRRVLDGLTQLWIDVARDVSARVPLYEGGQFHRYGLWAPGTVAAFAVDASNLFSPAQYRQVFLPFDRQIATAFDYVLIHTHSASAQHDEAWVTIPNAAIQVTEDPQARIAWPELLATCERIQASDRPLMVSPREEHYRQVRAHLAPEGLALRRSRRH